MLFRWILITLGGLVGLGAAAGLGSLTMLSRRQPATESLDLGLRDGRLAPCPDSPNCVSSFADDDLHAIEPIRYGSSGRNASATDREEARGRVREAALEWIRSQPRSRIVTQGEDYVHAVFRSATFGFMDDLELYLPEGESVIHLRSAARVGYGDMGVNRSRAEELRAFIAALD